MAPAGGGLGEAWGHSEASAASPEATPREVRKPRRFIGLDGVNPGGAWPPGSRADHPAFRIL
jgi:hypothetical protein